MTTIQKLSEIFELKFMKDNEPFVCRFHQIANECQHVSVACNLSEFVCFLKIACEGYDNADKGDGLHMAYAAQSVLLRMYLIVERLQLIFKTIGYPLDHKNRQYPVLARITCWANFLKHPKTSFFAHVCDGVDADIEIVNESLVMDLWRGEKYTEKTRQKLAGKCMKVQYPDFEDFKEMIIELSNAINGLLSTIIENPVYKEIISDNAILEKIVEN